MLFRTSLKQTLRTPVRLIAYFLVAALVTAFLCVGLNLHKFGSESQRSRHRVYHCRRAGVSSAFR